MDIRKQFNIFQTKRADIVQKERELSETNSQIEALKVIIEELQGKSIKIEGEIVQLYDEMTTLAGTLPPYLGEY